MQTPDEQGKLRRAIFFDCFYVFIDSAQLFLHMFCVVMLFSMFANI